MTTILLITILLTTGGNMIMTIVAVRDKKADCYSRPFFAQTPAAAIRSFTDEVNRNAEDNPYAKHPEDYALYELGKYEDSEASFSVLPVPRLLIEGDQCRYNAETYNVEKNFHKPFTAV